MLHQFYPDYEADSAYGIDYRTLYEQGYRGIIFDIDNTLVPHGAPATPQATEFFGRLRELGFQTLLLSNNKEPRVKSFALKICFIRPPVSLRAKASTEIYWYPGAVKMRCA